MTLNLPKKWSRGERVLKVGEVLEVARDYGVLVYYHEATGREQLILPHNIRNNRNALILGWIRLGYLYHCNAE